MTVAVILLAVFFVVSVIGWICQWAGSAALIEYMQRKGIHAPSDNELKACTEYVWNRLLRRR